MAAIEKEMLASGMPVASLMEKVSQGMVAWLRQQPGLLDKGVIVLVGPGHNGGDGLVVARELHIAGFNVQIWCPLPIRQPLTAKHWDHLIWLGIEQLEQAPDAASEALWIEAVFGLGQSRPLPDPLKTLLKERQRHQPGKLVSLDVPAGLCSDSGRAIAGSAAVAAATLSVGLVKRGLVQDAAAAYVGQLTRVDMGLPEKSLQQLPASQPLRIDPADIATLSCPQPAPMAMKYERGRLLVIAGSDHYRGAARLALEGALASGSGSVQAAVPAEVANQLWKETPEVVLAAGLETAADGLMPLGGWLAGHDLNRIDALLLGPGLALGPAGSWSTVAEPLQRFEGLLVLDADGLNRLANDPKGWHWLKRRRGPTWLTPHAAEFQRLFPELKDLEPLDAAVEAARLSGAVVLLKGAHSVVADPSGAAWQLADTADWVARTGLGDVLAGFAAGWGALALAAAQTCEGEQLATAVFLHAEAARHCSKASSALPIARSLAALTTRIQSKKHLRRPNKLC